MLAGSQGAREAAFNAMKIVARPNVSGAAAEFPAIGRDLQVADGFIAQAMVKDSWKRNHAWVQKFGLYVRSHCPGLVENQGLMHAAKSHQIVLAFLASVVQGE